MGQYYRIALVNNEWWVKVIKPDGWKLMEHSYYWTKTMNRVQKLLYREAMNVMRIGDYSKIHSFVWKHEFEDMEEISYDKALHPTEYLSMTEWENIDKNFYLVNKSQHEFINMTKQMMRTDLEDSYGWIVHPLPLLCKAETEEAWGDYHSEVGQEYIWNWCGDIISIYSWSIADEVGTELEAQWYKNMTDIYFFKE